MSLRLLRTRVILIFAMNGRRQTAESASSACGLVTSELAVVLAASLFYFSSLAKQPTSGCEDSSQLQRPDRLSPSSNMV